ncbi:MAG: gamma-glutamyltransferase [Vicinamibacterales bacterium]
MEGPTMLRGAGRGMRMAAVLALAVPMAASSLLAQGARPAQERSQFVPDYDPRAALRAHRPDVPGTRALVTSAHPLASMAGMDILMKGGNAFDAAVAVAATLNLVEPQSSGFGGNGFMTVYEKKTGKVLSLSMAGAAPKGIRPEEMTPDLLDRGIKAGIVPGNAGGLLTALERFGTRSVADVLATAIDYAERGVPINAHTVGAIRSARAALARFPTTAAIFLPGGEVPREGAVFRNPALAATFRKLVEAERAALARGASRAEGVRAAYDRFYRGDIAQAIADFAKANGGVLTAEDIAGFRAEWSEPLHTTYRGHDVYSNPSTSRGGFEVTMQLNLVEPFDLAAMGAGSADATHVLAEAIKVAKADIYRYVADPHETTVPQAGLLSKDYAASRRPLIDRARRRLPRPGRACRRARLVAAPRPGGGGALRGRLRDHALRHRRSGRQRGGLHADARRQRRQHGRDGGDRAAAEQRFAPRLDLAVPGPSQLRGAGAHSHPQQLSRHRAEGRTAEDGVRHAGRRDHRADAVPDPGERDRLRNGHAAGHRVAALPRRRGSQLLQGGRGNHPRHGRAGVTRGRRAAEGHGACGGVAAGVHRWRRRRAGYLDRPRGWHHDGRG